jgi:hypothetical protein
VVDAHVFVSYARSDAAYADTLAAYLRAQDVEVWTDAAIYFGDEWADAIQEKIDSCAAFVVVMSPAARRSAWVRREVLRAQAQRKKIFPLLLAGEVLFDVSELQHENVVGGGMPSPRWVGHLRAASRPAAQPDAGPRSPDVWFMPAPRGDGAVRRPELLDELVEALRRASRSDAAPLVALVGGGGFGKTTLAAMACGDPRVLAAFPDGILWKALGADATGPALVGAVAELVEHLTGQRLTTTDVGMASAGLADVLGDRRCLIVIDDVWTAGQLEPFLGGGPNCVRLVTARVREVTRSGGTVEVGTLTEEQATEVLATALPDGPTHELGEVAARTRG